MSDIKWRLKLKGRRHSKVRYKMFEDETQARIAQARHGGRLEKVYPFSQVSSDGVVHRREVVHVCYSTATVAPD